MASEIFGDEDGETRNFVRWYDPVQGKYQEQIVEILLEGTNQATIWSVNGLQQETQVYVKANSYSGNGIVTYSKPEEKGYRVIIQLDCEDMLSPYSSHFDPGVLALDGFLTEEEEAKILESLSDDFEPRPDPDETPSESFGVAEVLKSILSPVDHLAVAAGLTEAAEDCGRLQ